MLLIKSNSFDISKKIKEKKKLLIVPSKRTIKGKDYLLAIVIGHNGDI
jgi:hypothetical protein